MGAIYDGPSVYQQGSDGTSPWNRFSIRVPSYGSMDPSPKANYLGTRVLQNDSTVEKITGLGVIFPGIVGNLLLDPDPICFVLDKLDPGPNFGRQSSNHLVLFTNWEVCY